MRFTPLLAGLVAGAALGAAPPDSVFRAMEAAGRQDFTLALTVLDQAPAPDPAHARDHAYARAVILLSAPPTTTARIAEARRLFRSVHDQGPDDDLGLAAEFHLGRIAQMHVTPADPETARRHFQHLVDRHPDHWFGQYALLKLASLDLYRDEPGDTGEARVRLWIERGRRVTHPVLVRNLCWMLGDAAQRLGAGRQTALDLYRRGAEIGFSRFDIQGLTYARIHRIALELGHRDLAIEAARRFLENEPRALHRTLLEERIARLESGESLDHLRR